MKSKSLVVGITMRSNKLQVLALSLIILMVISIGAQAKQPEKYMQVFPFGADDFIMYALTFLPSLDLTIKTLVVTGVLYANETHFTNTTVIDINVTSNITVLDTVTAKYFNGSWNGTSTGDGGDVHEAIYPLRNDTNKIWLNDIFINDTEESGLNVNASNYWDNMNTPPAIWSRDDYVNESGDNVTGNLEMGTDANITDANSGSYMYFKPGGATIIHLEMD